MTFLEKKLKKTGNIELFMLQYITVKENINILYSPIAQLVEQMTVNHLVASSSLARGAIFLFRDLYRVFF